ncbi:hypothetical protein GLYMA_01G069750v4 [Glycine max]|nr:hypothetical protein GLYMA_01G069750v4 [Glycine max]KAH1161993.1 hypothetical protein GYH30_000739 [Glycine max]
MRNVCYLIVSAHIITSFLLLRLRTDEECPHNLLI